MQTPNLPSYQPNLPPPVSSNKRVDEKKPGGCLNILLFTLLFWVALQFFFKKPEEPSVNTPNANVEVADAKVPDNLPSPDKVLAALPKDLANSVKTDDKAEFITLGSMDANSPYRMLVTLSNRGAAVSRIELNEKIYSDTLDKTGYLGQIIVDETIVQSETRQGLPGVAVQVIGPGTAAEKAGLKPGDRIVSLTHGENAKKIEIHTFNDLRDLLMKTRPGDKIELGVIKADKIKADQATYDKVQKIVRQAASDSKKAKSSFTLTTFSASGDIKAKSAPEPTADIKPAEPKAAETKTADSKTNSAKTTEAQAAKPVSPSAVSAQTAETKPATAKNDKTSPKQPMDKKTEVELKSVSEKKMEADKASASAAVNPISIAPENVTVVLGRAPVSIVRPESFIKNYNDYKNLAGLQGKVYGAEEDYDLLSVLKSTQRKQNGIPLSFLMTLGSYDGSENLAWVPAGAGKKNLIDASQDPLLSKELADVELRNGYWDYVPELSNTDKAVFRKILLSRQLEVRKIWSLEQGAKPDAKGQKESAEKNYHLTLRLEIRNLDPAQAHKISYILDGPSGLPMEGAWYNMGRKTGPGWGAYGMRDLVVKYAGKARNVVKCSDIAENIPTQSESGDLDFIGIDTQYFQCSVLPNTQVNQPDWLLSYLPVRAGVLLKKSPSFTNTTFRMKSKEAELAPYNQKGDTLAHEFTVFAGPKQPNVLKLYNLQDTIVYGWFWFVSIPLLWILHFLKMITFSYALAIILLTVLVRLLLFPLSMKQNASMQKMQLIQPEANALKEKYKDDPQEFMRQQQALYRKYKINPLGGCLPMFIQLPIFIGLYKALSLDVNLYGVPLFGESVRWCSNLAAPDMFLDWSELWNSFGWPGFNMGILGPYLNLLPLVTIVLFLIQQKFMMPPVTGEGDAAKQQRQMKFMMNFMMIFMGFMFFKVPSGLCIYFIVSSIWGVVERKCLPKPKVNLDGSIDVPAPVKKTEKAAFVPARKKERHRGPVEEQPKSRFRKWMEDTLAKAQEQQRLAKAEAERKQRYNPKKRKK